MPTLTGMMTVCIYESLRRQRGNAVTFMPIQEQVLACLMTIISRGVAAGFNDVQLNRYIRK
jgi:hypothetical protein